MTKWEKVFYFLLPHGSNYTNCFIKSIDRYHFKTNFNAFDEKSLSSVHSKGKK